MPRRVIRDPNLGPQAPAPAIEPLMPRKSVRVAKTGAVLGPPWQKDHKLAMAAAIAARAQLIARR